MHSKAQASNAVRYLQAAAFQMPYESQEHKDYNVGMRVGAVAVLEMYIDATQELIGKFQELLKEETESELPEDTYEDMYHRLNSRYENLIDSMREILKGTYNGETK